VPPTVKIGLVAPFEGRYRYTGYDAIYAVRLALREVNRAGGVGGYHVELVAYDDGADPAMAVEQARKLDADPIVVASIGHFREETTAAALSAYAQAGIPLIAPQVLAPALTGGEAEIYRLGPVAGSVASELLQRLKELDQSQAALVTQGGPLGAALRRDAPRYHMRVWPVISPQGTGWLDEVQISGVEAVFCDADPVTLGEVVVALREIGWEGLFLGGPELAASDFVAVAGQAAEGALFVTPWPFPTDAMGGAGFAASYRAVSHDVPPGPLALAAYEATWVLLEALQRDIAAHGMPTREGMASALPATRRDGVLGPIAFDADRGWGSAPLYWYRIGVQGTAERMP
jgi:branched-chain amino acid transport system substrate-binding protein